MPGDISVGGFDDTAAAGTYVPLGHALEARHAGLRHRLRRPTLRRPPLTRPNPSYAIGWPLRRYHRPLHMRSCNG
ncbi:hypothetical protein [Streptomyces arenae]|uniref:hypothetical protein n=1 Tax=Streptomyces arenae TaxID=29301 RepID=UPI0031BAA241